MSIIACVFSIHELWQETVCYNETMKKILVIELSAALLFLGCGLALLVWPRLSGTVLYWGLIGLLCATAAVLIIRFFANHSRTSLIIAGAALLLMLLVAVMPGVLASLAFGFYMLFCAGCYFLQAYADGLSNWKNPWNLLLACGYLVLAFFLFMARHDDSRILQIAIGWYLVFQGLELLLVHGAGRHHRSLGVQVMNHMTSLPVAFVTFLPFMILETMEKRVKTGCEVDYNRNKTEEKPDLVVYIHTGTEGVHTVGHMTFCFEGLMYSYGNYARKKEKIGGTLGPAVFFTVDPEIYINNSCIYEGSTLYAFGLKLTEEQKNRLRTLLQEMTDSMVRWECPLQEAADGWKNPASFLKDYASRLFWRTGCKFYQFTQGPWRTYWVMGTNCSLFAETVLTAAGCEIPRKKGIVSPGEYFQYFEELFADPESQVICRQWHTADVPSTLFATWA